MQAHSSKQCENHSLSRYEFSFLFIASFLIISLVASYALSPPTVGLQEAFARNSQGVEIREMTAGEQTVLVLSFYNSVSKEEDLQFGAVIEVRNSEDLTVYVAWQSGKVGPEKQYHFSASWIPEQAGIYYLKTRVITALPPAEIIGVLSPVLESRLIVV